MSEYQAQVPNHAMLFTYFAGPTLTTPGGEEALRRAVIRYGLERGGRMAARAKMDGMPLTVDSYLLYGEWAARPDETHIAVTAYTPEVVLRNSKCPWLETWEQRGIVNLGKHYCAVVDASLARGFDPDLDMDPVKSKPLGAPYCEFFFRGRAMDDEAQGKLNRNREKIGGRARMDWNYHVGHLYSALYRVLREELGQAADRIEAEAMDRYGEEFGPEAVAAVRKYRDADFSDVAAYPGTEGLEK